MLQSMYYVLQSNMYYNDSQFKMCIPLHIVLFEEHVKISTKMQGYSYSFLLYDLPSSMQSVSSIK